MTSVPIPITNSAPCSVSSSPGILRNRTSSSGEIRSPLSGSPRVQSSPREQWKEEEFKTHQAAVYKFFFSVQRETFDLRDTLLQPLLSQQYQDCITHTVRVQLGKDEVRLVQHFQSLEKARDSYEKALKNATELGDSNGSLQTLSASILWGLKYMRKVEALQEYYRISFVNDVRKKYGSMFDTELKIPDVDWATDKALFTIREGWAEQQFFEVGNDEKKTEKAAEVITQGDYHILNGLDSANKYAASLNQRFVRSFCYLVKTGAVDAKGVSPVFLTYRVAQAVLSLRAMSDDSVLITSSIEKRTISENSSEFEKIPQFVFDFIDQAQTVLVAVGEIEKICQFDADKTVLRSALTVREAVGKRLRDFNTLLGTVFRTK